MRVPSAILRICRAVVEKNGETEETDETVGDVEYWSRVETVVENGREIPTVKMVLRIAEICPDCKFFRSVFVVAPERATCESCYGNKKRLTGETL